MWGVIRGVNYPLTLRKTFMVATEVHMLLLKIGVFAGVPSEAMVFPRIDSEFDRMLFVSFLLVPADSLLVPTG